MSDKAVHSPGPWRVDENWVVRCPSRGFEDNREADGNVCKVGYLPNAKLIAAAPDLLAACQGMIDAYWRGSENSGDARAMVKAALTAIKKATE